MNWASHTHTHTIIDLLQRLIIDPTIISLLRPSISNSSIFCVLKRLHSDATNYCLCDIECYGTCGPEAPNPADYASGPRHPPPPP